MRKIFKNRHIIVLLLVALIGATCLAACGGDEVTTTVTYYVNGSVHGTVSVTTGMTSSGVADPTVPGYTFGGWFTDEACTTPFDFAAYAADEGRADISVYAKLDATSGGAVTNTITYYVLGEVYDTVTVTGGVLSGNVVAPSVPGYTFGGWYTDQNYSTLFDIAAYVNNAARTDIAVYARMVPENDSGVDTPVNVTVSFDVNGGRGSHPSMQYNSGDKLADLPVPERDDHTFAGWQTADGTVYENGSVVPAYDLVLIAQWTPDPSTVTLMFNGETIGTIELTQGEDYVIDPIPGYTLVDWKIGNTVVTDSDGASLTPWQFVAGEYTMTATASATIYHVEYELGGGENAYSNPDVFSIEDMDGNPEGAIELDDPSLDSSFIDATSAADGSIVVRSNGRQFLGWYTDSEYVNQVTELTLALGDVTLYAKWGESTVVTRTMPYLRVDANGKPDEQGGYLLFGSYPQTIAAQGVTINTGSMDGYGNFTGSDGCFYRRVKAAPYSGYSFSDYTVIREGTNYYFKLEPLRWQIVSTSNGSTLLVSEKIIAATAFGNNNGYSGSNLRNWMNNLYNSNGNSNGVFSAEQRELIAATNVNGITERIFALSDSEYTSAVTGKKATTDYALAVGAAMENRVGYWWLRTAHSTAGNAKVVNPNGIVSFSLVDSGSIGVAPALNITLY